MGPSLMEKQRQISRVEQVDRAPDGPALHQLVRLHWARRADIQSVEGGRQELGLDAIQVPAHQLLVCQVRQVLAI